MPDIIHDTTLRFNADTQAAVASMGNMDKAMGVLAQKSGPAVGRSFGMMASSALSMTSGVSGATGALSALGQAAFVFAPQFALAAVAVAAVTALLIRQREEHVAVTETIRAHRKELEEFSKANLPFSDQAKILLALGDKAAKQELAKLERTASLAKHGLEERRVMQGLVETIVYSNITRQRQIEILAETIPLISQLSAELGKLSEQEKIAADNLKGIGQPGPTGTFDDYLASVELRYKNLQQIGPSDPTTSIAEQEAMAEAERKKMLSGLGTEGPTGTEAGNLELERQRSRNDERLMIQQEAREAEAQLNAAYDAQGLGYDQAHTDALRRIKEKETRDIAEFDNKQTKAYKLSKTLQLESAATTAAQMLILQKASLGETVKAIIDEREAHLASLAIVALAEAVYYSFTNPAIAATKFKAAAMAGAGAIGLAAIGSAFEQKQQEESLYDQIKRQEMEAAERDAVRDQVRSDLGYDTGPGGGSSRSRQSLASTGPVTIYYSQSNVINGNVYGMDDLFALMDRYNENLFRRLGLDVSQATR